MLSWDRVTIGLAFHICTNQRKKKQKKQQQNNFKNQFNTSGLKPFFEHFLSLTYIYYTQLFRPVFKPPEKGVLLGKICLWINSHLFSPDTLRLLRLRRKEKKNHILECATCPVLVRPYRGFLHKINTHNALYFSFSFLFPRFSFFLREKLGKFSRKSDKPYRRLSLREDSTETEERASGRVPQPFSPGPRAVLPSGRPHGRDPPGPAMLPPTRPSGRGPSLSAPRPSPPLPTAPLPAVLLLLLLLLYLPEFADHKGPQDLLDIRRHDTPPFLPAPTRGLQYPTAHRGPGRALTSSL